ncbi:zf-HC2 domain-containing protein [Paenibacillus senegalensis]|uniref:zf-HC2 domain-containing protein n=1 Tax=Paenibacillus senegalensis TaxID=1465766 RepID=UPI000289DEDE|nr:zf-HC2 domain-containing protein [Paenibacillus senegalensis]
MSKCRIAQDLIPLVIEELAAEESEAFVRQHISECEECRDYFKAVQEDFDARTEAVPDNQAKVNQLGSQLAKYQNRIKLGGVLAAMLLSCIVTGASVEFLYTLPLLILTPFACRLYYGKMLPILAASLVFGGAGAILSDFHSSYIPFFALLAFVFACMGIGIAELCKLAFRQRKLLGKSILGLLAGGLLIASCLGYFSFFGNPVGYMEAMVKSRNYVNQTYEQGTLVFKGVGFDFKTKNHFGKFEYVLNGTRQVAAVEIMKNDELYDHYQYVLETRFIAERSSALKSWITAAVDYLPVTIAAEPEENLNVTRDMLSEVFDNLSYDPVRRSEAAVHRQTESAKLNYVISIGAYADEMERLPEESFSTYARAIQEVLHRYDVPYHSIQLQALTMNGNVQCFTISAH